ncbi:MAG: diaminopropionate ammonia-lyase, partial [Candidatus Adiutrix sp.]
ISMPDFVAANGMRILGAPLKGDGPIVSGESGAATVGALDFIVKQAHGQTLKSALKLNENSKVLLISTEGATAPEIYRQVLWYGDFAAPLS